MATRRKTLEYWVPMLATAADNVKTALSQITLYIPEAASGTITFRKVILDAVIADASATPANVTGRTLFFTLQGATESSVNNTQAYTQSGENMIHHFSVDMTSYFTTNWGANGSRTFDSSITINTGATGSNNISVKITIDYDFDDTQTTHIKTVWIPLNADINALPTTKPGSPIDTIPALDTYCPEATKTFRQIVIVSQGNEEKSAVTDISRSWEIDSLGVFTSQLFEGASNSSKWYRLNEVVSFDTSVTHGFYSWASTTDFDHPQNWLVVTYEFSPSSSTRMINSLLFPMEFGGAMGGPTSADYQRASKEFFIQEPGTINNVKLACFIHYDQLSAIAGMNARVGTGSFVTYSSVAAVLSGGCGLMIRNDGAFTLARGRNTLTADIYNTDASDLGYNLAGWWMVNYHSDIPSQGFWAANHTVIRNLKAVGTQAAATQSIVAATAPDIPEATWFLNAVGIWYVYTSNSTGNPSGVHIGAERLSAGEGGLVWENAYESLGGTDAESGIRQAWAQARTIFRRFRDGSIIDQDPKRLPFETARRWRVCLGGNCASFDHLDMVFTYHSITFTISGTVTDSNGGAVTLSLHRVSDGEKVMETTRTGNGAYSFNWFDNTEEMYVVAREDNNYIGRSANGLAT
jgi:hypothetical protein